MPGQDTKNKNGLITSGPHNTDNQNQVVNNASVGRFVFLTEHNQGLATTRGLLLTSRHATPREGFWGVGSW